MNTQLNKTHTKLRQTQFYDFFIKKLYILYFFTLILSLQINTCTYNTLTKKTDLFKYKTLIDYEKEATHLNDNVGLLKFTLKSTT
jgi:hypothetical protein